MKRMFFYFFIIFSSMSAIVFYPDNVYYDNFLDNQHSPVDYTVNGEIDACLFFLKNGGTFFDVGANFGLYTASLIQNKSITAYCFEPIPQIFAAMKRNFSHYQLLKSQDGLLKLDEFLVPSFDRTHSCRNEALMFGDSPIHMFNLGLSNYDGRGTMFFYPHSGAASSVSGFYHEEGFDHFLGVKPIEVSVFVDTIDRFCVNHNVSHINFLKIDTEGNDFLVLRGAENMIKNGSIDCIQFEYMVSWQKAHTTLKEAFDFLTQYNYVIYKIFSHGLIRVSYWRDSLENYIYANYLAIKKGM